MISLQRVCGTSQLATVVKGFRQLPVCLINTAIPVPSHYSAPCRPCCQASSPASSAAGQQQQRRQQQQQQAAPPRPLSGAEAAFYAQAASNFSELGVTQAIAEALEAAGFDRPSRVQELALPAILSGKDIVLAAETGSGKTLAYIAPITSVLAKLKQAAAAGADGGRQPKRQLAIVLCPNAALCQQVVRLVSSLQSPSGEPLLRACQVASSNPPPFEPPDVVVTTPGALVNLFNDRGFSYGSQWTAEGVSSRARFVVVDEADLLSQGGYVKDLMRLLDAFKAGERRVIESQVMEELGLSEDDIRRLPRHIRQACWDAGVPGMLKAGYKVRTQQQQLEQPADKVPMWSEDMKQQATVQDQLATGSNSTEDGSSSDPFVKRRASSSQASSRGHSSYGPYFRRQYLLVAATMPALTKGDVGVALQKRFKEAAWVSGDMLHQIKPHVQHQWVKVGEQGTEDALVQALQNDSDYQAQKARVLIFAKDTTAADNVSGMLQGHGIHHVVYHKNVSKEDRDAALAAMSQASEQTGNTVMVSTDAAARGIDLPDITHVLQADFAATAIEFLHRVGRTARAGKPGKVTSMYGRSDAVLAEALQQYIQEGRPIQDCFSRNRSFSRKVKRYGKFVPRGQEGPQKGKASVTA